MPLLLAQSFEIYAEVDREVQIVELLIDKAGYSFTADLTPAADKPGQVQARAPFIHFIAVETPGMHRR